MPLKVNEEGFPAAAAVLLLALVTCAILPNAYEPDIIKQPLLVGGTAILLGLYLSVAVFRKRIDVATTPADIPILLLLLLVLFQTLGAPDVRNARAGAFLWGAFAILFFAGTHLFRTERKVRLFISSVVVSTCIVECVGAVEVITPGLLPWEFLPGGEHRVGSTLGSASILAGFFAGTIPLLCAQAARTRGVARAGLAVLIAGAFGLLLASGSRGGLIAALVSTGMLLILVVRNRMRAVWMVLGLASLVGMTILVVPSFHERFLGFLTGSGGVSLDRRIVIWEAGWNAARSSIVAGHGTGSLESVIPVYRSPEYWMTGGEDIVRHAHNVLIELWAELGISGVLLWLLVIGLTLREGLVSLTQGPQERRMLLSPLVAGLSGILVENLAGISLFSAGVGGYAWLMAGTIWGFANDELRPSTKTFIFRLPRWTTLVPFVAAAAWAVVYAAGQMPMIRSEAFYVAARALEARGAPEAREAYMKAYEACSWNPDAGMAVAGIAFQDHRREQSLRALDDVQARFPLYPRSNLLRGMVMASLGRYREAKGWIGKELQVCSSPDAEHVQALVARAIGDTVAERRSLRRLIAVSVKVGRNFFVGESSARILELGGGVAPEDSVLIAKARKDFGIAGQAK
jgi:O-antigen ligase